MRIILITAPSGSAIDAEGEVMLEAAFRDLAAQQPGHEWLAIPADPDAGKWSFFRNRKRAAQLKELSPALVLYGAANFQTVKNLPAAVMITHKLNAAEAASLRKKIPGLRLVITHSTVLKQHLVQTAGIPENHISVVPLANETVIVSAEDHQHIREQLTGGKEFFLYAGPIEKNSGWERLLHAFSQFKKWQQSGFQLVLTGNVAAPFKQGFAEQLESYKYRNDVMLAGHLPKAQRDQLAPAAFVTLSPCRDLMDRQHIIDAFRRGIPVITEKNDVSVELAGDAAAYAAWNDPGQVSQQMITLYKDEALYNELVQKGAAASHRFNRPQMLDDLSGALLSAAEL